MLEPKIIKTKDQHRAYLAEVERLAADDPAPGTPDGDRLELLAKLVEDYEKTRFPFRRPDPIEAIRFRMEEQGLRQKDLVPLLGGRNRVSEVLAGKRPLTVAAIRALSDALHIPADLLVREPQAAPYRVRPKRRARQPARAQRKIAVRPEKPSRGKGAAAPGPSWRNSCGKGKRLVVCPPKT